MNAYENAIRIQQMLEKTLEPFNHIQQQYAGIFESTQALTELLNNIQYPHHIPHCFERESIANAINSLACMNDSFYSAHSALIALSQNLSINSALADISRIDSAFLDTYSGILNSLSTDVKSEQTGDYITFDKTPIKEWDLTETVAIPIGNNRVKMKTSDFISLLGIIVTVLIFVITFTSERLDAISSDKSTQQLIEIELQHNDLDRKYNEIEEQKNQTLYNFLSSIDASNSSQAEAVEDLKESVLSLHSELLELKDIVQSLESAVHHSDSASQVLKVTGDHDPATENNNPE